ncbi:hypothetical protein CCACVL1_24917 [Corchorus capsularis]|uniref:Uncharacterized protein n=1 Tax=Corchorus capsularis TaxID=210143 RepID=A0A1R3GMT3_COCAP|nr:hypothetical protein CCACVL1_24917 [Corchorus capsularis]
MLMNERCFIFNGKKVFIGLEDVLRITGLPIDGNPVIVDTRQSKVAQADELLALPAGFKLKDRGVTLKDLRLAFMNSEDKDSHLYLRALLLCVWFSKHDPNRTEAALKVVFERPEIKENPYSLTAAG